jgi:hypothetical protein
LRFPYLRLSKMNSWGKPITKLQSILKIERHLAPECRRIWFAIARGTQTRISLDNSPFQASLCNA